MIRRNLGLLLFALACAHSAAGCGTASPYAIARVSLSAAHRATQDAVREWGVHYERKVAEIVDGGIAAKRPVEDIRRDLAAWRATADKVDAGFRGIDAELRAAGPLVKVLEKLKDHLDVSALLATAINAVRGLVEAAQAAGFDARPWLAKIPGVGGLF